MDWFHELTGFREESRANVHEKLRVEGDRLVSRVNGKSWAVGKLDTVSLGYLRERAKNAMLSGRIRVNLIEGNVGKLHAATEHAGALFQVASQFNALEMTGPNVTPDHGVTRYEADHTQGPACAIAAGAATIYRNYFVPLEGELGQTKDRQIDGLSAMGATLSAALGRLVTDIWQMSNGYALCHRDGLDAVSEYLASLSEEEEDTLRAKLAIMLQTATEVTRAGPGQGQRV